MFQNTYIHTRESQNITFMINHIMITATKLLLASSLISCHKQILIAIHTMNFIVKTCMHVYVSVKRTVKMRSVFEIYDYTDDTLANHHE